MILKRQTLELFNSCKRDNKDRRKKVVWAVFSYLGDDNNEYRQAFTFPIGTPENMMFLLTPEYLER